jgi:hypothetical protein
MREGDPAVLLSTAPDKNDEIALLLKVGSFTPGQTIEMTVRGRSYHLISGKLLEGGDEFDWARYKVISNAK